VLETKALLGLFCGQAFFCAYRVFRRVWKMDGDKTVEIPDDYGDDVGLEEDCREDEFESAVRMAFIGAGQGGGRLAQAFYDLGYRRVCAVNTTDQDLAPLSLDNKFVIGNDRGGAGKDPEQGRAAAKESYEDIMDLMMRSWGENVDQIYCCVGAGGGSGTGSW
jgi:cell division GTPase FtsZ